MWVLAQSDQNYTLLSALRLDRVVVMMNCAKQNPSLMCLIAFVSRV